LSTIGLTAETDGIRRHFYLPFVTAVAAPHADAGPTVLHGRGHERQALYGAALRARRWKLPDASPSVRIHPASSSSKRMPRIELPFSREIMVRDV
jgi:hypothetical protein